MKTTMWLRIASGLTRSIIFALAAGYAGVTIVSALHFVTAPIVVGAAITLSLAVAAFSAK